MSDDLAAIGIQSQMQFAPTAAGSGAMLLLQPLARAVDLKAGAVDKNMDSSVRWKLAIMPSVGRLPCPRGIARLAAPCRSTRSGPHGKRFRCQPQGQAATSA